MPDPGALATHGAAYAARGWALVPLVPETKRPYIRTGADHAEAATCDLETVAGWVARYPDADIGIVPARAGFVVVDIDDVDAFEAYRSQGFDFPLTSMSISGRECGGAHLWYRVPPGAEVPRGRVLTPGLELKAAGQLVVAPPSRHRSGRRYRWDVGPELVPPQAPAGWMLTAPTAAGEPVARARVDLEGYDATPEGARRFRGLLRRLEEAGAGRRHPLLYWSARQARELADAGHVTERAALDRLERAAGLAFAGELADERARRATAREITNAIRDGWQKGAAA